MKPRLIDLSAPVHEGSEARFPVEVRPVYHAEGARQMAECFGVPMTALPESLGWAGEEVRLGSHAGTHMDAPWHYGPTSEGKPARTIDAIPLDWCYAPGVVLDVSHLADGQAIGIAELEDALARIGHQLAPGEIVLLRTGAERFAGDPDYPERGSGLVRSSVLCLVERGIRIIGTDAWGLDRPFGAMRAAYRESGSASEIWPAHFAGREREYCQLEKLRNLGRLPAKGFTLACFPIRLQGMSAGWVRAVAILPDVAAAAA